MATYQACRHKSFCLRAFELKAWIGIIVVAPLTGRAQQAPLHVRGRGAERQTLLWKSTCFSCNWLVEIARRNRVVIVICPSSTSSLPTCQNLVAGPGIPSGHWLVSCGHCFKKFHGGSPGRAVCSEHCSLYLCSSARFNCVCGQRRQRAAAYMGQHMDVKSPYHNKKQHKSVEHVNIMCIS